MTHASGRLAGNLRLLNDASRDPRSAILEFIRMLGRQEHGALSVDMRRGGPLAHAQTGVLVGAEEFPEFEIVVAWQASE